MTQEQIHKIDAIATYYAMEHDLNPKIIANYCYMLTTLDFNSLDATSFVYKPETYALYVHISVNGPWDDRFWAVHHPLIAQLRRAKFIR